MKIIPMYSASILPVLFLTIIGLHFEMSAQVKFQEFTIEKARENGVNDNKLVLVYFSSNVCPGCKIMDTQVFSDKNFGDFINENFLVVRSNASTTEGRMEQYLYQIRVYPTLIYFDPIKGEVMRLEGKKTLDFVSKASEDALAGIFELGDKIEPANKPDTNVVFRKGELIKNED